MVVAITPISQISVQEQPPPTPTTAKFIDAEVAGLTYTTTSGISGVTSANGEFEYKENDVVTFYLGGADKGVKIGAASAQSVVTPFEVAGKYNRSLNLAILLQSLDEADNGNVLTVPVRNSVDWKTLK